MRPLNRPMFKMGGAIKEGIMDGIREPKADGGNIGGGVIQGRPAGQGRTGYNIVNLIKAGGSFLKPAVSGVRNIFGRNVGTSGVTTVGGKVMKTPSTSSTFVQSGLGKFFTGDPTIKAITSRTPGKVSGYIKSALPFVDPRKGPISALGFLYTAPTAIDIVAGAPNQALRILPDYIEDPLRDLVGLERPGTKSKDPNVVASGGVGQVKQPGTVDTKTVPENKQGGTAISDKFNDDGTEKSSSVENLLKAVRERSRVDATGDALIAAGERIRTGGIDSDTVGDVIKSTSQAFDKDSELRQRLDLAQIESELKKEQIKAQAIATNPIIMAANLANVPVETAARRNLKLPTTLLEFKAQIADVSPGAESTAQGTEAAARAYVKEILGDRVAYQGIIGDVKKQNALFKKDEFKTDPLGTIAEVIQGLPNGPGGSGVYVLGTSVYLYNADTKTATALD